MKTAYCSVETDGEQMFVDAAGYGEINRLFQGSR